MRSGDKKKGSCADKIFSGSKINLISLPDWMYRQERLRDGEPDWMDGGKRGEKERKWGGSGTGRENESKDNYCFKKKKKGKGCRRQMENYALILF